LRELCEKGAKRWKEGEARPVKRRRTREELGCYGMINFLVYIYIHIYIYIICENLGSIKKRREAT